MKRTRILLSALALLVIVAGAAADDYTADSWRERYDKVFEDDEIVALCREYMENSEDIEALRAAQDIWEDFEPDEAGAFISRMRDENPNSARSLYLYGRYIESATERVRTGREVVRLDPDWPYGYRLILATYGDSIFSGDEEDDTDELKAMLADDIPFFDRLIELAPDEDYPYYFKHRYLIYAKDYEGALEVLKDAPDPEARWASKSVYATVYAGLGRFDDALEASEEEADARIKQGWPAEDREQYVYSTYRSALTDVGAYDKALEHAIWREDQVRDSSAVYDIACIYALMGNADESFAHLKRAVDMGWDQIEHTREDPDLEILHDDARWSDVLSSVQTGWDEGAEARKEETLASLISKDAYEWKHKDVEGNIVKLKDLRGNILILDFWATWCPPCIMAMPVLNEFVRNNMREDVKVFSIDVWEKGRKRQKRFMEENGYEMTLLYGDDKIVSEYGIRGIPYLCVIDKEGKIRYEETGYSPRLAENLIWWTESLR